MKKIAIIDEIRLSGPGTKNIIYKNPEVDGYIYVDYLSVIMVDVPSITIKKVEPKYDRDKLHFLGDIVEYDEETNTISDVDPFRELSEFEINDINFIYQRYMQAPNGKINFDLIVQSLVNCSNKKEMAKVLKQSILKAALDDGTRSEIILDAIRRQMLMRKSLQLGNINGQKR